MKRRKKFPLDVLRFFNSPKSCLAGNEAGVFEPSKNWANKHPENEYPVFTSKLYWRGKKPKRTYAKALLVNGKKTYVHLQGPTE